MAPLVTHLVIGERVFAQLQQFDDKDYGSFLLGCVLVDVNSFSGMDRRRTHFVGRLKEDGTDAFNRSCASFLSQLDGLLLHPWSELTEAEQSYVAGYLCHLDFPAILSALNDVAIPQVLTHVPHDAFQTMWDIVKEYMLTDCTPESYFEMLEREGKTDAEIQEVIRRHDVYWEDAVALIHDLGCVEPVIQAAIRRSLDTISRLWV